jgi:hypothetical protein
MIRAIIDDRVGRAWAILFGMLVMATAVGGVTIILHDRVGVTLGTRDDSYRGTQRIAGKLLQHHHHGIAVKETYDASCGWPRRRSV